MTNTINFIKGRPETALSREDVRPGDKITSYVPGDSKSVRRYIIVVPLTTDHAPEDSRGDLLLWVCDLDTGLVSQMDTATLGLTCSPDGTRTRWAIPYDEE